MNRRILLPTALTVLTLATLTVPALHADAKPLKAAEGEKGWDMKGSIGDVDLQKLAPASGVITSQKAFAELWKAWMFEDKMPQVDFSKTILLVATTRGSRLNISADLDDKGDLRVRATSTKDLRPGFRYMITTQSREGVKTFNGKELPKE